MVQWVALIVSILSLLETKDQNEWNENKLNKEFRDELFIGHGSRLYHS